MSTFASDKKSTALTPILKIKKLRLRKVMWFAKVTEIVAEIWHQISPYFILAMEISKPNSTVFFILNTRTWYSERLNHSSFQIYSQMLFQLKKNQFQGWGSFVPGPKRITEPGGLKRREAEGTQLRSMEAVRFKKKRGDPLPSSSPNLFASSSSPAFPNHPSLSNAKKIPSGTSGSWWRSKLTMEKIQIINNHKQ